MSEQVCATDSSARSISFIDILLAAALLSPPIFAVFHSFGEQQSSHQYAQKLSAEISSNTELSLKRARWCRPVVASGGDEILPTLIGANWKGDSREHGQYLCALDGSTARIISGEISQISVIGSDRDLAKYHEILYTRGFIDSSQLTVTQNEEDEL